MLPSAASHLQATTFGLAGRALSMSDAAGGLCLIATGDANNGLVPAKTITQTLGSGEYSTLVQARLSMPVFDKVRTVQTYSPYMLTVLCCISQAVPSCF
jgi:hypothetical protein